jgi:carbamoyltransferase
MNILGINAYHGDVAAVLVRDGQLVAAIEEERLSRIKHVSGFPERAIRECLRIAGIDGRDIQHVAISRNPRAHLWRKALFAARRRPGSALIRNRAANYRRVGSIAARLAGVLGRPASARSPALHWIEHHPAHLASAFLVSPFESATVCAVDGFGDFVSTSVAHGRGANLDVRRRTFFPHSLGLLYLAVTQYLGFRAFGDEFKVMGLAPYGAPEFAPGLRRLFRLKPRGSFELDLDYFTHWTGAGTMTWDGGAPVLDSVYSARLEQLLGPARQPNDPITERHQAIAASLQTVFEEALWHVLNAAATPDGPRQLCLAGGCAMNSSANGRIRSHTPFTDVWIQPAAGDNGTALGAAFHVWNVVLRQPRSFVMRHAYWGSSFGPDPINVALRERQSDIVAAGCATRTFVTDDELCTWTTQRLAAGDIVGWFQGRMEWGARALGNRSILADPRRADIRDTINRRIKLREPFRPFAPSVTEEACADFFDEAAADAFMMQVSAVRPDKRAVIPAVTHVDGSARPQVVRRDDNRRFWMLLDTMGRLTGVPVLLNTSFNENEPIVHDPSQAIDCFLRTRMDVLVLGNVALTRAPGGAN